jgi:hypothetical protein
MLPSTKKKTNQSWSNARTVFDHAGLSGSEPSRTGEGVSLSDYPTGSTVPDAAGKSNHILRDYADFAQFNSVAGGKSEFMRWLTVTHTQRWHAAHRTGGTGPLYQERFKSFPIEEDDHLWTVLRYAERNALRAGLVERAEERR